MRVICPVRIFDNGRPLSDALLQVKDKVHVNTNGSDYYIIFIPFELNILYSQLTFRSSDLDITIDIKPFIWANSTAGTLNIIFGRLFGLSLTTDDSDIRKIVVSNISSDTVRVDPNDNISHIVNSAIFNPFNVAKSVHMVVRKNDTKVADIRRNDAPLDHVKTKIYQREFEASSDLRDFADIKESEIYINFLSGIMDIGGENNYEIRDFANLYTKTAEMVEQLEAARLGMHPCPTALRGVGIRRMKSAR